MFSRIRCTRFFCAPVECQDGHAIPGKFVAIEFCADMKTRNLVGVAQVFDRGFGGLFFHPQNVTRFPAPDGPSNMLT
jgi:hypothetical protein